MLLFSQKKKCFCHAIPTPSSVMLSISESKVFDQVLDFDSLGVQRYLGQIADTMSEWEGSISENLELVPADIAAIKTKYPMELNLQM